MGANHSNLLRELSEAAEAGNSTLHDRLPGLWMQVPDEVKSSILGTLNLAEKKSRWCPAEQSMAKIKLDDAVVSLINKWGRLDDIKLVFFESRFAPDFPDFVVFMYRTLDHLETSIIEQRIKRRVLLVVLSRLRNLFNQRDQNWRILAGHIAIKLRADASCVENRLTAWALLGARYDLFAQEIGSTDLLLALPLDIPDSSWEVRVPKFGEKHDEMVKRLEARGIREAVESCYGVTDKLIKLLWDALTCCKITGLVVDLSQQDNDSTEQPASKDAEPGPLQVIKIARVAKKKQRRKKEKQGGPPAPTTNCNLPTPPQPADAVARIPTTRASSVQPNLTQARTPTDFPEMASGAVMGHISAEQIVAINDSGDSVQQIPPQGWPGQAGDQGTAQAISWSHPFGAVHTTQQVGFSNVLDTGSLSPFHTTSFRDY